MARIACSWSAASAVRAWARRARERRTVTVVVVSRSHDGWTRRRGGGGEHARELLPAEPVADRFGAAMTRLNSCRWASAAASTADRRAASSTDSACRSPLARGVPSRGRASASRAARIASSGSDLAPLRRWARSGRSSSITISSAPGEVRGPDRRRGRRCPRSPRPAGLRARRRTPPAGVAVGVGVDGDLAETPPVRASTTAAAWVCRGCRRR